MKTDQKYYIGKNDKITIRCLACKRNKTIAIANLKMNQHTIKVVCPCSNSFFIHLEFRQSYRKKMGIEGSFRKRSEPAEQEETCLIRDISLGGLGITITNDTSIQVGDELIVSFKLGTFQQSGINAIIRVQHTESKMNIGGMFVGSTADNHPEIVTIFLR